MEKNNSNQRRDFLKKIPIAIISMSAFSIFKFKKTKKYSEKKFKTLSKTESDEIIKNNRSPFSNQLKPAPAPVTEKSIKG